MSVRESNETRDTRAERETKSFSGYGAIFDTNPEEIFIELHPGRPAYIRLKEADYLQEGDAFHREQLGMKSPTLDTWEIISITPEIVVGREIETGEEVAWDRDEVEKGLAIGTYSTNLTDFERISVYQVGNWNDYDPDDEDVGTHYTGLPYVSVVAYGDNGLKYGRRYRFAEPESNELYLWKQDRPVGGFAEEVEQRLNERVRDALEADGYTVTERDYRLG